MPLFSHDLCVPARGRERPRIGPNPHIDEQGIAFAKPAGEIFESRSAATAHPIGSNEKHHISHPLTVRLPLANPHGPVDLTGGASRMAMKLLPTTEGKCPAVWRIGDH